MPTALYLSSAMGRETIRAPTRTSRQSSHSMPRTVFSAPWRIAAHSFQLQAVVVSLDLGEFSQLTVPLDSQVTEHRSPTGEYPARPSHALFYCWLIRFELPLERRSAARVATYPFRRRDLWPIPLRQFRSVSCVVFHTVLQRCVCCSRCFCRRPCCCPCGHGPRNLLPPRPRQLKVQRRTPSSPRLPRLPLLLLRVPLLLLRRRRRQARCPFRKWS